MVQGLFRSAQHKKQAEFLGRSFENEKDQAAAAKNAFVLLAQHRPQLAAGFFILGLFDSEAVIEHRFFLMTCLHRRQFSIWVVRNAHGKCATAGGRLKDAVGVCAHELADPQLAIFVARLLEPQQQGLLSNLLANELLPSGQSLLHFCKRHLK